MTLRYHKLTGKWAIAVALLAALFVSGCGGGGDINGGNDAQYTLEILAEKDLDEQVDYLHIRFLKDGISVIDGFVTVNGDSLGLTASGNAFETYPNSHFPHGEEIEIEAVDPEEQFIYTDSVFMPIGLTVDVVPEADTIWQPTDGAVNIQWSLSNPVSGYIVSVTPRTPGNPAPGLAEEVVGNSFSFSPLEVFYDQLTDTLVSDLYDVRMVAYNRTYVRRPSAPYVLLPTSVFPLTTDTDEMAARISAVVISPRAVIVAQQLNP